MKLTTAGESHGKGLVAIVEGIPAKLPVSKERMAEELSLRGERIGRSDRQKIEREEVEILSGVYGGETIGSPICLMIKNADYKKVWEERTTPRPGHADLPGMQKFGFDSARFILERASARETAIRVASASISKDFLHYLGIEIAGRVCSVAGIKDEGEYTFDELKKSKEIPLGILDKNKEIEAERLVEKCQEEGDTLGGTVEIRVKNLKSGFGSCMTHDEKLDALLAYKMASVQLCKGVRFGDEDLDKKLGKDAQDEIFYDENKGFYRKTNHAGGIEGGMSNGEELVIYAYAKPVPTQKKGLKTVDVKTKEEKTAFFERSDTCPIFAFERIMEGVVADTLVEVIQKRLGGDSMVELKERYQKLP